MRDRDILINGFEDIKLLQCWLYMDESHVVIYENSLGVKIQIRMTENMQFLGKNLSMSASLPEMNFDADMTLPMQLAIIKQLKEQPAEEFSKRFPNRWEEIKELCKTNLYLNSK